MVENKRHYDQSGNFREWSENERNKTGYCDKNEHVAGCAHSFQQKQYVKENNEIKRENIEIETKLQIADINKIVTKLIEIGFILKRKRTLEHNIMLDNKNKKLMNENARLRIRTIDTIPKRHVITYKKPILSNKFKREIEYTIRTKSEHYQIKMLLEKLGYNVIINSYERFRTIYSNTSIIATIDEYPFNNYLELEGNENDIKKISDLLGYHENDYINKSCDDLFYEWRQLKGLSIKKVMRFKDYDQ